MSVHYREPSDSTCAHGNKALSCFTCDKRSETEWCNLSEEGLRLLNEVKVCNVYRSGQLIYYQGNPCMGIHCVEGGSVALRKTDHAGNSVIVGLVHEGQTMGYRSFFSSKPYGASAEALEDSRVCFIDRAGVRRLIEANPSVGYEFLSRMAGEVEAADADKLHATALPMRGRLAHLLVLLKERYGEVNDDGTLLLELPLSRQDIASMLGTRPETVARIVRALQDDGVALFDGRHVQIPDLDALLDEVENYTDL
jgi:CRP/FNR family transcriptional regulator